jgi:hypothetical protein
MGRWLSPDWSAKEEPVPYAKLDDPQTLNLYAYVRNNPLSRVDADGHTDWCAGKNAGSLACGAQNAWNTAHGIASKVATTLATQATAKVTIGIGLGGAVKLPVKGVSARAEIAAKEGISFSNGKLSDTVSANGGITVGAGKTKFGAEISVEKQMGSINMANGEMEGAQPATPDHVWGVQHGDSTASGSAEGFTLGGEVGDEFLGGGEISITKEGLNNLKDAAGEAWNALKHLSGASPTPTQ